MRNNDESSIVSPSPGSSAEYRCASGSLETNFNPFSTKSWTPGAIPYVFDKTGDDPGRLARRLEKRPVAQIVGPHGSGKSTLLESLAEYYRTQGIAVRRAVLNDCRNELPEEFLPKNRRAGTIFLLDGYERLSFRDRVRLRCGNRSTTQGLVWTTHRPARGVPVLHRTVPRYERFAAIVRQLTAASPVEYDDEFLRNLFERSGKNFRTAFFELYDLHSDSERPCHFLHEI